EIARHAQAFTGEHDARNVRGLTRCEPFDRQHRAPRVTQNMHGTGRQRVAHGIELGDESLECPERRIIGPIGTTAVELVPKEYGPLVTECAWRPEEAAG